MTDLIQFSELLEIQPWIFDSTDKSQAIITTDQNATGSDPELTLMQLRETALQCQACSLAQSRHNVVFGEGNPNATVLFVGEAPGMHEDQQGRPFVGQAGQLLTAMLQAIGLEREQIFIANILKCRPPQNRDPAIAEMQACTPFLKKQIELIKPTVIVALGRHAAHYFLKTDLSLNRLRSKWYRYEDSDLLVTYHPAYLLRNPIDKQKTWDDLCQLKKHLNKVDTLY